MTTVKLKIHHSQSNTTNKLFYEIKHNDKLYKIDSGFKISLNEWSATRRCIIFGTNDACRIDYLRIVSTHISFGRVRLLEIVRLLTSQSKELCVSGIIDLYREKIRGVSLFDFMLNQSIRLYELQRPRAAESCRSALNSFMSFRCGRDLSLTRINSDIIERYVAYLKAKELSYNTISFYMRILRAIYNRAVEQHLTIDSKPFKYTPIIMEPTKRRALPLHELRNLVTLNLNDNPKLGFARDIFLFSIYCRGISFVDIAYLRKSDINHGVLRYRRRKTGQIIDIAWEDDMQQIVNRYPSSNEYLLPIITDSTHNLRAQYQNVYYSVNRSLKEIAKLAGIDCNLTTYVARYHNKIVITTFDAKLLIVNADI